MKYVIIDSYQIKSWTSWLRGAWESRLRSHLLTFKVYFHFETIAMTSILYLLLTLLLSMVYYIFSASVTAFFSKVLLCCTYIVMLSGSLFDGIYLTPEYSTLLLPFSSYIPLYYSILFSSITFNSIPFKIHFHSSLYHKHVACIGILIVCLPLACTCWEWIWNLWRLTME